MFRTLKNQNGFSMAQVMVAGTIMAIMSVGLAEMISQQSKSITYMEDRMSHQNFKKEIETAMSDDAACTETLNSIILPAIGDDLTNVTNVVDSAGNEIYNPADPTKSVYDQIKIDSIKLDNIDVPAINTSGQVKMIFNIKRLRKGGGSESLKSVEIVRNVNVDASFRTVACTGGSNGSSNSCLENDGGRSVSFSHTSLDVSHVVPADVKALKFVTNTDSVMQGGDNDCHNQTGPASGMFLINGKSEIGGIKLEPGKILRFVKGSDHRDVVRVYYNNALVASGGNCYISGIDCHCDDGSLALAQPVMACPKGSDYSQTPSTSQISVSFWK